jgi:transposase
MTAHGLPVYVALEPVDMRFGYERLGGIVRERMEAEPRSRALFVFVGKRGHTMKVLTWDGTGAIVVHKKLDAASSRRRRRREHRGPPSSKRARPLPPPPGSSQAVICLCRRAACD